MERVAVIDYGMGNLRSVLKALQHEAGRSQRIAITSDPQRIARAGRVVFPGQGAMRDCMHGLRALGLVDCVLQSLRDKPFLGICIGLQALMERSEEDAGTRGLAVLRGDVRRFPVGVRDGVTGERLKIPHMGWNRVRFVQPHALFQGIDGDARFYFANSYFVVPEESRIVAGVTDYACEFVSAVARENLFAVQFHPEKSQQPGLTLLRNFLRW